jgi:hypothetical protein
MMGLLDLKKIMGVIHHLNFILNGENKLKSRIYLLKEYYHQYSQNLSKQQKE